MNSRTNFAGGGLHRKITLYHPDGTPIKSFQILSELDRWKKHGNRQPQSFLVFPEGPARIVDAATGQELYVRHSWVRSSRRAIRLKAKGKPWVLATLGYYHCDSRAGLQRALFTADCHLAKMANLKPPAFSIAGGNPRPFKPNR